MRIIKILNLCINTFNFKSFKEQYMIERLEIKIEYKYLMGSKHYKIINQFRSKRSCII